jgi:peptide/nickel transport system permease protein
MTRLLLQRLASLLAIVLGMVALVFGLSRTLPGSPVQLVLGAKPTAEQIAQARQELGLDQPLPLQFAHYASRLVQGDLGRSLRTNQPVAQEIGSRLAASAELVTLSLALSVLLGVPLGIWAATRRGAAADITLRAGAVALVAVPAFFLGILLQMLFYGALGWLPLQGRVDGTLAADAAAVSRTGWLLLDATLAGRGDLFASALAHLALPVLTLAAATLAMVIRVSRNLMVEVLQSDHVRTARAYGIPAHRIHFRWALKATLVPLLTIVGLTYGLMLGGSVVVEFVFDWPGIGGYIVEAVAGNDFPAVVGVTLTVSTLYLLINLAVDLLYLRLDPKLSR